MSRVDDDAQERRVQERLALDRQRQAEKNKEKAATDSKFAKLVFKTGAERTKAEEVRQDSTGRDVIDRMKGFGSRIQRGAEPGSQSSSAEGSRMQEARGQEDDALLGTLEDRHQDSRVVSERLEERKESQDQDAAAHLDARDKAREDARADAGGGGASGGKDQGSGGDQGAAAAQGFKLNPALMAPVAVAQPRTGVMSEKLRALANEIAQKIVQNVRVGTNRAGEAEFQIDLKSSVLNGLQIKVSSKHGKITAVFSGKDTEVLKLIKQNADGLKSALQGRGLTLADLRIEERK
ncbi:MAG TPA: flagellar hook-length control protein FliK [Myxococcaceae bacterium]|jgi:hypothetical protein